METGIRGTRMARALRAAALAGLAGACGLDAPPEPTLDPLIYEVGGFRIEDATRVASPDLIASIAAALGTALTDVTGFLPEFVLPADTITFVLLEGGGIPFVTAAELRMTQWEEDLALDYLRHQVTHLLTGYLRRPFLEEGIAVYVTEALDPAGRVANPYRGQVPDAWVSLFEEFGSTIPLGVAHGASNLGYSYSGSSADASAWQLFIEAGSFTRWVFATYGRDAWLQWYESDDLTGSLSVPLTELEQAWLAAVRAAHPTPLPCEEALSTRGPLTSREEFWCARARGE
jgi:hypothetical protein